MRHEIVSGPTLCEAVPADAPDTRSSPWALFGIRQLQATAIC